MIYTEVSDILEHDDEELKNNIRLDRRSQTDGGIGWNPKRRREARGSIDFDFDETEIILNENGID